MLAVGRYACSIKYLQFQPNMHVLYQYLRCLLFLAKYLPSSHISVVRWYQFCMALSIIRYTHESSASIFPRTVTVDLSTLTDVYTSFHKNVSHYMSLMLFGNPSMEWIFPKDPGYRGRLYTIPIHINQLYITAIAWSHFALIFQTLYLQMLFTEIQFRYQRTDNSKTLSIMHLVYIMHMGCHRESTDSW